MRTLIVGLALLAAAFVSPAGAQTSIVLHADPVPIIDAQVNGRPVRLEVDLRLPDILALNPQAAERLGVRTAPFVRAVVQFDDTRMRGRIARPRIVFGTRASRALAGIFATPASLRADGLIGPGALPFDVIRVELGDAQPGEHVIVFRLDDPDIWRTSAEIGGSRMFVTFDLANDVTTFNRTASSHLDQSGAIVANGPHTETAMLLGLRAQTQPVSTALALSGLPLSPAVARSRAPLLGALEEDAIVAEAEADPPPPSVWAGRQTLRACASITVDRRARTMTLSCAG